MLEQIFATKLNMTQAWSTQGKRLAVTRCKAEPNLVVNHQDVANLFDKQNQPMTILEIGYGQKKFKNMSKPLKSKLQKGGFSIGTRQLRGIRVLSGEGVERPQVGTRISVDQVLEVGDVVDVQGVTKGRGFAGVVKRHGFKGGPRTHGQSDRLRAPGSIGSGTTPGRVWPGLRMAGHMGVETKTVSGLVVLHIDKETGEIWLSGPIPGFYSSTVRITKTGQKSTVELNRTASGIVEETQPAAAEVVPETEVAIEEAPVEEAEPTIETVVKKTEDITAVQEDTTEADKS